MITTTDTTTTNDHTATLVTPVQKQLEYYFSDENLSKDSFFHEKISTSSGGYLPIDLFLKCNKIVKLGSTKEDIIEAAERSKVLEVNNKKDEIRRLESMPLPELKLLQKKRKAPENGDHDSDNEDKSNKKSKSERITDTEEKNNEEPLETLILTIKCENPTKVTWKEVFNKFKDENANLRVVYFRFDPENHEGNAAIFKNEENLTFKDSLTVNDTTFKIWVAEGDEVANFWTKHGTHFELCLNGSKKGKNKNYKNQFQSNVVNLKEPMTLGDETFTELPKIKVRVRKILSVYKDNEPLKESDHKFMFDLLKVFNKKEEKQGDIKQFVINPHKTKSYYRTFFSVYNDDSRDEFSVQKCIEKIMIMNSNSFTKRNNRGGKKK